MTLYDVFVIVCLVATFPVIIVMGVLCWIIIIRLIIDLIKYGL